jgi:GDSL-like Lipase/Acylhydrolase family
MKRPGEKICIIEYKPWLTVLVLMQLWLALFSARANGAEINYSPNDSLHLGNLVGELNKKWPNNRSVNLVFHGHSVPSGYQKTPIVETFGSYPLLLLRELSKRFPFAVVNAIKTSKGGENAEGGLLRFRKDVLRLRPDVIFLDYALNDRSIGLSRSERAWGKMIKMALSDGVKVVLLTPTPDLKEDILDPESQLALHSLQIIRLAKEFNVPVVDCHREFRQLSAKGISLGSYMAQNNHINIKGHLLVSKLLLDLFAE